MKTLRAIGLTIALGCSLLPSFTAGCSDTTGSESLDATERAGRFELFKGEDSQHYFQLLAGNGEQLLRSEGYVSLSGAKNGIDSVRENAVTPESFDVLEAQSGEFYFNVVAKNHQIIATSDNMYASRSNAEQGVETVIRVVASASAAQLEGGGPHFESFAGSDGQTYFRLRAGNGEIVLQSEGYASASGAEAGIASVKDNGTDPASFHIHEAQNGQYYFTLVAGNDQVIGFGELYASKYNAERGAETVRRIIRELTETTASDDDIQAAVEAAADGAEYMSEAEYPYTWVHAELAGETTITEELVREKMAPYVDGDPDADGPLAELFAMTGTWAEWRIDADSCAAEQEDEYSFEQCVKRAALDLVLEENLTDIQVYYFGSYGEPGYVDGVGVSIIVVGLTPAGNLAGVRTIAIWT